MPAAVIAAPGRVEVVSTPIPQPGRGEVRIRLEGSGVCGSELPVFEGRPWFAYPQEAGAPGHEGWGIVDSVGDGVHSVAVGERVVALSDRAHALYDLADQDAVVRLPDDVEGPFPGEALGCAMNVFKRSRIRRNDTVAIVGIGFLGALLVQLAAHAGARVIAITRRRSALELVSRMGAAHTVVLDDPEQVVDAVASIAGGLCDRVIEVTGQQAPLDLAARLTRVRGTLVIAGFHQDGPRHVDMQLWNWRGLDVVNAHERDPAVYVQGISAAIEAVRGGRLDPAPLYTHTFPLERLDRAFATAMERPDGFMKALVVA